MEPISLCSDLWGPILSPLPSRELPEGKGVSHVLILPPVLSSMVPAQLSRPLQVC